jgi:prepilin-type N-terminal cleavage/methylation domain-containing protein
MRSDERGFTLIELLVASAMMVVITGATVSLFISTIKDQARITKSGDQIGDARLAIRLMVDDIRQGVEITATTPLATELKIKTYIHAATCAGTPSASATAIQCNVTYKCVKEGTKTTYECTRAVETGSTRKIIGGLSTNSVFTYSPASKLATYVGVKLTVPGSTGTKTTTFEGGAGMRNSVNTVGY